MNVMKLFSEEEIENQNKEQKERMAQKEKESEEKQSLPHKIRDFWIYEKWKVIIPIIVLVIVVTSIQSFLNETKEVSLFIAMINPVLYSSKDVTFQDTFAEEYQLDTKQYPIRIDTSMIHPEVVDEQTAANPMVVASIQKYQNYIANGEIDVTITNDWMVKDYEQAGVFMNLKEALPDEVFSRIEKYIIYHENDKGENIPVAIDLEKLEIVNQYYVDKPVLVIPASAKRPETAIHFVEWITKGLPE